MKIAVVAPSAVPFVLGGAERLWNGLVHAINELTPHDADLLKLPSREHNLPDLVRTYAAFAQLDLGHFDLVVSSKYPAWAVRHPRHVVYLQHRLRGLYDLYGMTNLPLHADHADPGLQEFQTRLRVLPDAGAIPAMADAFGGLVERLGADHPSMSFPGPLAREIVHAFDRVTLQPGAIHRYAAISKTVASRPGYFPPGVPVRVVHHPSDLVGLHHESSDYFFTASRLDRAKRIDLIIEGMRHVAADIRLVIAGTGPDEGRLRALAAGDPRIEFAGYVTSAQLVEHYARARAVPFVPYDEDLGLVTLEAGLAHKPVVTCTDSGGSTELVSDGVDGYVVAPTAQAVGSALSRLAAHGDLARRMGDAAHSRASKVTWPHVIDAVLSQVPSSRRGRSRRPRRDKLVVTSTFPVHPRRHGGQLRAYHLYGRLTESFDVQIVSLVSSDQSQQQIVLADGFVETLTPRTIQHDIREAELYWSVGGIPVADISAARFIDLSPAYLDALRGALADAVGVILAEPFLHPALQIVRPDLPWVYDAYNVEVDLKRMVLPASEAARENVDFIHRVEGAAARGARLLSACSDTDRARLVELYDTDGERAVVVPNGVDLTAVTFTPLRERRERAMRWLRAAAVPQAGVRDAVLAVFVGSGHPPNIEAVKRLVPVALASPDVLFVVLGSACQPLQDWVFPQNMVLLGVVGDEVKNLLLSSAHVALNPVEQGSGTNLKLVEYFAAGAPVVATPVGARGLGAERDRHLLVAELSDHRAFSEAIRCAASGARVEPMVREARRLAERFDWDRIGDQFSSLLVSALADDLSWAAPRRGDASRPPALFEVRP